MTPQDVMQGGLGDCWMLASLTAVAEYPYAIKHMFPIQKNNKGFYIVNLYTLGVPHSIIIDDYIPTHFGQSGMEPMFAKGSADKSMWPILMEKAFAKAFGSYD